MSALMFDSHAHYFDRRFSETRDDEVHAILQNDVFGNGVGYVVNIGTNPQNSRLAIEMASHYDGMYATVGIHPEDAQFLTESPDDALVAIEALISDEETRRKHKTVALGEIGLDYHSWANGGFTPDKAVQKAFFERQMELARKHGLPVVIHDREAHGDSFETVLRFPEVCGVFHSYSGSAEMARELMRRGWYISFSGVVTFKNAERVREVASSIDLDKLLIETDEPYLAPHPFRGKRNHSGLMRYTAETLAEVHGIETDELIRITTENAARLYGIALS
ncbi:MAG: TatD family hydrolase [Clostridia bacterium]|nr:TatD family hydrolase [Clostridia bacterium]